MEVKSSSGYTIKLYPLNAQILLYTPTDSHFSSSDPHFKAMIEMDSKSPTAYTSPSPRARAGSDQIQRPAARIQGKPEGTLRRVPNARNEGPLKIVGIPGSNFNGGTVSSIFFGLIHGRHLQFRF